MDKLSLSWRGMAGSGKRTQLIESLKLIAKYREVPFTITTKTLAFDSGSASTVAKGEDDSKDTHTIDYETSFVHIGFDVARMSMQDKNILRPVLTNYGKGSHVLSGSKGRGNRIIVLYHSHLLSSESILIIQSVLEQNNGDLSIWLTSELPITHRIRDWFIEVPVSQKNGIDLQFEQFKLTHPSKVVHNWSDIFKLKLTQWRDNPLPKLSEVDDIKKFVYELLMRNLRWVECVHFLLDIIIQLEGITEKSRKNMLNVLANTHATGGGITLPSYRIPIVWENLFLKLRNALIDGSNPPPTTTRSKKTNKTKAITLDV